MKDRILKIRKVVGLTQKDFAVKLELSQNFVWMIENGNRIPSERTIADICREFNVNRHWLETGEGEMFNSLDREKEIAMFFRKVSKHPDTELDQFRQNLVIALAKLDESEWEVIAGIAAKLAAQNEKNGE